MADASSTPSEIQAELRATEKLVSELATSGPTVDLLALEAIAQHYFGGHPWYAAFMQDVNRSLAANG